MNKHKAQKDILYIAVSSFAMVVLWIGFNLYHAYATSTIEPDLQVQIIPIDPTFDKELINKLKSRQNIQPVYELNSASNAADLSPTPTATTQTTTASDSAASTPRNTNATGKLSTPSNGPGTIAIP